MDYEEKTELFRRETGIWPPGRDMPAALCGGEDIYMTRQRAYEYWCKAKERIKELEIAKTIGIQACDLLKEQIEQLEDALQKINNWAKAYPLEVFPEPDFKKAADVLKSAGLSLDAISASNMRHVIFGVKDIVEQVLKGGK